MAEKEPREMSNEMSMKIHKTHAPFTIIEHDEKFMVTIGNNVVSRKEFKSLKNAENYVKSKPYELIINATCFCMSQIQKEK